MISNQFKTDKRVIDLVKALLEKFNFVSETKSLRNKTYYLQSAITNLLEVTKSCCDFIKRYFDRWFISRFMTLLFGSGVDLAQGECLASRMTKG